MVKPLQEFTQFIWWMQTERQVQGSICEISGAGVWFWSRRLNCQKKSNDDPSCSFEGKLQPGSWFFQSGLNLSDPIIKSNPREHADQQCETQAPSTCWSSTVWSDPMVNSTKWGKRTLKICFSARTESLEWSENSCTQTWWFIGLLIFTVLYKLIIRDKWEIQATSHAYQTRGLLWQSSLQFPATCPGSYSSWQMLHMQPTVPW